MDVTNQNQIERTYEIINKESDGSLFGLINNAGIGFTKNQKYMQPIVELDVDKFILPLFEVNIIGVMRVTHTFIKLLNKYKKEKPVIVNISSGAGNVAVIFSGAYSPTKFSLVGYSDVLRRELDSYVRVSCIEPGAIDTPLIKKTF